MNRQQTKKDPMKILAIIPARGGSKGVPGKNLQIIGRRPLIEYSIRFAEALLRKGLISQHIVSTDDNHIASVAQNIGGNLPFLRPAEISGDEAKASEYIWHALKQFEDQNKEFDAVLLLQPTSPLRDLNLFSAAIERFKKNKYVTMISCYREDYVCDEVMYFPDTDDKVLAKSDLHNRGLRRQDHGSCFVRNGALYLFRSDFFKSSGQIICGNPAFVLMSKYDSINIDTVEDLEYLRGRFPGGL